MLRRCRPLALLTLLAGLAAGPAAAGERVAVKAAVHDGYARIVFDWPTSVRYTAALAGDRLTLHFARPLTRTPDGLVRALRGYISSVDLAPDGRTLVAVLMRPVKLRSYVAGRSHLVVELMAARETAWRSATVAQAAAALAPIAPAASAPMPPALPARLTLHYAVEDGVPRLRFDWPTPVPAAVYRRAGTVWIVFGAPTAVDLTGLHADALGHIEQLPDAAATVLRLQPPPELAPSIERAGTAWIVDWKRQPTAPPEAPIAVSVEPAAAPSEVRFAVTEATAPIMLRDPDVGDRLLVFPVGEIGRGIGAPRDFIDFSALSTVQGIVLAPHADGLAVHVDAGGIVVTRPGGLALSSPPRPVVGRASAGLRRLFDFAGWAGPPGEDYVARRSRLERAIVAAAPSARGRPRLDLARFYFAHLFGAETLAVLAAVSHDEPQLADTASVRALKGAACLLAQEFGCAARELGQHGLDAEPEAALWRAALAAAKGDAATAAPQFLDGVGFLSTYPRRLRDRFALEAAETLLDTGRAGDSAPFTEMVEKGPATPDDQAMALYLDGRRAQEKGKLDVALALWQKVAALPDARAAAHARYARATALFEAGKASREATIKALDGLRFAWRGGPFEFALLHRLGALELAAADPRAGLEALQTDIDDFPANAATPAIAKEAADGFAAVFLGPGAKDVPPLKALALYDSFHNLEPTGPRRDQVVGKLIDRLVSVDLLSRAADLLQTQVTTRLTGSDKAVGATRLALLHLMDYRPDAALSALAIDVGSGVSPALARERQQLRARALLDLNRPADALSTLTGDDTRDAERLRADIYWHSHQWPQAAIALGRIVASLAPQQKLDADSSRLVLSWAAALTMATDKPGLAQLRASYGPAMAKTPDADSFRLLAGGDGGTIASAQGLAAEASRIAELGDLQSFMAAYKQRLSATKLSAIN